jgi:hypothetical protein
LQNVIQPAIRGEKLTPAKTRPSACHYPTERGVLVERGDSELTVFCHLNSKYGGYTDFLISDLIKHEIA